jgi:hypothetical protein
MCYWGLADILRQKTLTPRWSGYLSGEQGSLFDSPPSGAQDRRPGDTPTGPDFHSNTALKPPLSR